MRDIFDSTIMCEDCNKKTEKGSTLKEGFKLRYWKCPSCSKVWYHPADLKEYEEFNKLRQRKFAVKLRMVGNSWAISIPREIIDFQEEMESTMEKHFQNMEERMNRMVRICLEEPGKISLFMTNETEKVNKKKKKIAEVK